MLEWREELRELSECMANGRRIKINRRLNQRQTRGWSTGEKREGKKEAKERKKGKEWNGHGRKWRRWKISCTNDDPPTKKSEETREHDWRTNTPAQTTSSRVYSLTVNEFMNTLCISIVHSQVMSRSLLILSQRVHPIHPIVHVSFLIILHPLPCRLHSPPERNPFFAFLCLEQSPLCLPLPSYV